MSNIDFKFTSAARCSYFVVNISEVDFREDIHITLLATGRDQCGEDIRERILAPALAGQIDSTPDLIVIPIAVENRTPDLQQLHIFGETAGELQIPVLLSTSPTLFQLDLGAGMDAMLYPSGLLSCPQYAKWNVLRKKDASRWLSQCCNRFLLRQPYTADQRNTLGLTESIHHNNDYLWGEPVWLLANLITASFARCHWPTEITGMDNPRFRS